MRFWATLCLSVALFACATHTAPSAPNIPFAFGIVDENGNPGLRPLGADLVPAFKNGGPVWLKREGRIEGRLVVNADVGTGPAGSAFVEFALTQEGADQLATLTRANIGQWLAMVVKGKVVMTTLIAGEAPRIPTPLMLDGNFTAAEAHEIADGMMATYGP